jgi:hypothetical protein
MSLRRRKKSGWPRAPDRQSTIVTRRATRPATRTRLHATERASETAAQNGGKYPETRWSAACSGRGLGGNS